MNKLAIILFSTLLWVYGCSSNSNKDFSGSKLDYSFAFPDSGDFYFPLYTGLGFIIEENRLEWSSNEWYSKHLYSLEEPILYNEKKDIEIYRYTNLGTWERPFSFRIVKTDSIITITKKVTDGHGGYDAGKLILNQTKKISIVKSNNFLQNIDTFNFWLEPTNVEYLGIDGAQWILEGYKNGEYHFIHRWSPDHDENNQLVKICNSFEEFFNNINIENDTE